jgi:hypothetical protein
MFLKKLVPFAPELGKRVETKGFQDLVSAALKYTGADEAHGAVPVD